MTISDALEVLNKMLPGWTASNTLLVNPHPSGGIIDQSIGTGEWFVILPNSNALSGFDSLDDAIEAYFQWVLT